MPSPGVLDAVVVGAGPNGLAAAVVLAREGLSVLVLEGNETIGGGARTAEATLPGYLHDTCSAIHPLAVASPLFRDLPLARHGLDWIFPPVEAAHPMDGGTAVLLKRSVTETAEGLGEDGPAWTSLMGPLLAAWTALQDDLLGPPRWPRHPVATARFGLSALRSADGLARGRFSGPRARALFAGLAAHSVRPLDSLGSAAFGLVLGLTGHAGGWPMPRGGAQAIANALAATLRELGGEIVTGRPISSLAQLPPARATLLDVTPRQLVSIAGPRLPALYRRRLSRYRHGPGTFKLDWALSGPIPWRARECGLAGTVHLGGTLEEIAASEAACWRGAHADRPFVLLTQPTLFDASRAPQGRHVAWAYCHVPHGSTLDRTEAVERQVERFAPGFRELILARRALDSADFERLNPNLVGGDVGGGSNELSQVFFRPVASLDPHATPVPGLFLCSSSTPPGGGVHGLCGLHAARSALRRVFGRT